jgi:hypothetical protein
MSNVEIYRMVKDNPGLGDIEMAQKIKVDAGITRFVDCLDIVEATREALKDEQEKASVGKQESQA